MALGKPAIPGVRTLALRDVQGAIDRIRERFNGIDTILATTSAQAGQNTLNQLQASASIANLQRQISALVSRVDSLVTDDEVENFDADTDIAINQAVYASSAEGVSPVIPADGLARYGVIGVATVAASAGGIVSVRKRGVMEIADAVFEPGGPVYASLDGLTQFPDYVNVAIPVGVAVSTDEIEVAPGWPALQYPGVYSEYETFLPATWGLVRDAVQLAQDFNAASNGVVVKTGTDDVATRTITGTANRVTVTNGDGVSGNPTIDISASYLANPTASVGLTAVNGVATTAMRSDAAPALNQGISPTWTGTHIFNNPVTAASFIPTSSSVPQNGLYLESANTPAIASNGSGRMVFESDGTVRPRGNATQDLGSTSFLWATYRGVSSVLTSTSTASAFIPTSSAVPANGLYLPAANVFGLSAGSTEVLRGNSSGAIGVSGANFGTAGQVLTSAGSASAAVWATAAGGVTGLANPTASVGLTAVNGSATTAMRSDAAPALSQAILPVWTGLHTFSKNPTAAPAVTAVSPAIHIVGTDASSPGGGGVGTAIQIDTFAGGGVLAFRRATGTAASPTAILNGQGIFNLHGYGYGSTGYSTTAPAVMSFNADETWTDAAQGSFAQFLLTPIGSAGSARVVALQLRPTSLRLLIDNQELQIGAGQDLRLYHDGTDSFVRNDTGALRLNLAGTDRIVMETTRTTLAGEIAETGVSLQTPTTGFAITIAAGIRRLQLEPAGALATGTVTTPASPANGDLITIATTQAITTLTIAANTGQTLANGAGFAGTLAAGGALHFQYQSSTAKWYRQ